MLVVGIVAAILLAAGLLPPYGELWKRKGRVVGINWVRIFYYPVLAIAGSEICELIDGRFS